MLRHSHHWMIGPQDGKYSWGTCYCGKSRLFRNAEPEKTKTPTAARKERIGAQKSARMKERLNE